MSADRIKMDDLVRELDAFASALPTSKAELEERYVLEYHDLLAQLEPLSDEDLTRYRIGDEDIKTANQRFEEEMGISLDIDFPGGSKRTIDTDLFRSKASRLVSRFSRGTNEGSVVQQHIVVTGSGNQTVVGVAGGSLEQNARHEVTPGDDAALIEGLEAIGISPDRVKDLKRSLADHADPDGKKYVVRSWIKGFTTDVLSGTIGGVIASQAPAALAMALGYLS
ncbi:MAG: hypothetical protein M9953_12825 [Thermomicrobiales bacterium]|nr:hypothetical protein [Thermomicrobiales bacterium]MCO5218959.1 hypothetical protein [Thermomicrobiales bacterium]MCO5226215.1 hypothetical protein [Thermomicrobiales bacterium]MCO5228313.1 hypothetical protein [Thermomicrobiales bacterium]